MKIKRSMQIATIVDTIFIGITLVLMVICNNTQAYGLAALENMGEFVVYLIALISEVIILAVLLILLLLKKINESRKSNNI